MSLSEDMPTNKAVAASTDAVPNATAQTDSIAMMPVDGSVEPHLIPLSAETDDEMFNALRSASILGETKHKEGLDRNLMPESQN